ncbi:hypothetical protein CORC01_10832 [Colletotrichum orchidophilum]|uniref:Uncharacterized protein n=1 Tax=Colletotrichum orchidophilum TaxID=1209926 RepID=A0A1G4AXX5_9PEZI|nr:uncharacterized protein CORC01_10832 [Colletotrichum orchidophilum]OHE93933.1 hypothetical protein CORC01_10832 [Colletotrichum orchidophilum]
MAPALAERFTQADWLEHGGHELRAGRPRPTWARLAATVQFGRGGSTFLFGRIAISFVVVNEAWGLQRNQAPQLPTLLSVQGPGRWRPVVMLNRACAANGSGAPLGQSPSTEYMTPSSDAPLAIRREGQREPLPGTGSLVAGQARDRGVHLL